MRSPVLSAEAHLYMLEPLFPLFLRTLEQKVCETVSTFSTLYFRCLLLSEHRTLKDSVVVSIVMVCVEELIYS